MALVAGTNMGFESIDRGITLDDAGSRTIQLTCNPAVTGGPGPTRVMGDDTGRYLVYIRRADAAGARKICVFDFKLMNNLFLWDDQTEGAYTVTTDGKCFLHLSEGSPGKLTLSRVKFADFSVDSATVTVPATRRLVPDALAADDNYIYCVLTYSGGAEIARFAHSGGPAETVFSGGPECAGAALTACASGLWFTVPTRMVTGHEKLARGAGAPALYHIGEDGKAKPVLTPALAGDPSSGGRTAAVPLYDGGLYLPAEGRTLAPELEINECCLSADGKYFVCDRREDDAIIAGSLKTGAWRVLNLHGASRGLGWHTRPRISFSGNGRWVAFGSDRTGISQAYAAYVPKNFLERLDGEAGA